MNHATAASTCEPTPAALAFAGVVALAAHRPPAYRSPIHGLKVSHWRWLHDQGWLVDPSVPAPASHASVSADDFDEFGDLVALLLEHATVGQDPNLSLCLAHAVATACMGANHLWQDLGLPERSVLTRLMAEHFAPLKARNHGDMRWKKFFYRELCAVAEVPICKSPSCAECVDQPVCFGPEDGLALQAGPQAPSPAADCAR